MALEDNMGMCYAWTTSDGLSATAVCDMEYPEKAAMTLITKLLIAFKEKVDYVKLLKETTKDIQAPFPEMEKMLAEWQNPTQADKLLAIEKELTQVQDIMHKNLKDLLDRGESIEAL